MPSPAQRSSHSAFVLPPSSGSVPPLRPPVLQIMGSDAPRVCLLFPSSLSSAIPLRQRRRSLPALPPPHPRSAFPISRRSLPLAPSLPSRYPSPAAASTPPGTAMREPPPGTHRLRPPRDAFGLRRLRPPRSASRTTPIPFSIVPLPLCLLPLASSSPPPAPCSGAVPPFISSLSVHLHSRFP